MNTWNTYKFDHSFSDLAKFDKYFVGADKFFQRVKETSDLIANNAAAAYPPFNLKKTDDNVYVIEMAVAGFGKQDIEVELEDNKLVIRGNSSAETPEDNFLVKGIGMRSFTRTFAIDYHIEVQNAELLNGMLKIVLEKLVPEDKKFMKIEFNSSL